VQEGRQEEEVTVDANRTPDDECWTLAIRFIEYTAMLQRRDHSKIASGLNLGAMAYQGALDGRGRGPGAKPRGRYGRDG
jgi:hypothetical protein